MRIPRHIGSVGSACNDEFCPQLWYTSSGSHGHRRSLETRGPMTHDFYILPREYEFQGPKGLVRRDDTEFSSEDCEFEQDMGELDLFSRLSVQEANGTDSAITLTLMSFDELESRVMDDVRAVPNVTEHGMTFSQMERPGVHCLNIKSPEGDTPALRGVYILSDNEADIHVDTKSYFDSCQAKIG